MPRVDSNYWLLETSTILREEELSGIRAWAMEVRAIVVTSPSLVPVEIGGKRVTISAGVGSLLATQRPPLRSFRLSSVAWVDGCVVGEREPRYVALPGEESVEGTIIAIDQRDPVAMFLNGVEGIHEIAKGPVEGAVAVINGMTAVAKSNGYISYLASGEGKRRADYIGPLVSSCLREIFSEDL